MKHYLFHDANGEARMQSSLQDDIEPSLISDLSWIELPEPVDPAKVWVQDGQVVPYSPGGSAAKASPPPHPARWHPSTESWEDLRGFAELKAAKWAEIKAAREAAKIAPTLATPYGLVDADPAAIENVKSTLLAMQFLQSSGTQPGSITWTMADDSEQELTMAQLGEIAVLMLGRGNVAHERGRELRAQIDQASTPAELAAVAW